MEETVMDTTDETWTDDIDTQRYIIKDSLDEGLHFPVYITVRKSGDSLATIATPLDPSDDDWSRATAIVCEIIGQKIGDSKLRSRELLCAVANAAPIIAAEVTVE
jgi:hypothetical protein